MKCVVVIGVSTGGPQSLQQVIPLIPAEMPAAILIVQHMPPKFTKSLAERLNSVSKLSVKEAEDGELLKNGWAYIAPGDFQMIIKDAANGGLKIALTCDPPVRGHRPAVNVTMNSLADTGCPEIIGVIMTGMGADGSEGIVNIKEKKNGYIIAQDKESCVVYGMPKSAVQTGVVDAVIPLSGIAEAIVKNVGV
jgi:two-component system chemotaxis response regulator CheB